MADEYVLKDGKEWCLHYKNAFNDGFIEASKQDERIMQKQIDKMLTELKMKIEDTGAYEQEVNGKTEFLEGINYCLSVINKYRAEVMKLYADKGQT